ncbi:MAG: RDD family protein [Pyrinomonadaceae bacterium]
MQCSACRAVYSNGLEACPRCKTPVASLASSRRDEPLGALSQETAALANAQTTEEIGNLTTTTAATTTTTAPPSSTLIEFPGAGRAARPQWRKELSERVRAIQERRAREAEETAKRRLEDPLPEPAPTPQLGLVPPSDAPPINPIVAAALKRIERARQPMPRGRASMSGAAVAVAHVAEDEYNQDAQPEAITRPVAAPVKAAEPQREHNLAVVTATQPALKTETLPGSAVPKRTAAPIVDDELLPTLDDEELDAALLEELYDDRAPLVARFASGFIDLLVVAFASSPFAAIIELTNGNWMDPRVSASMGGIVVVVMFLYLAASTAMTGRTWGMSLVSLRAVDADTGLLPTTRQAVLRALVYMISLATLGLGILYALFDAEGRAAHDHLSSTAVVRE